WFSPPAVTCSCTSTSLTAPMSPCRGPRRRSSGNISSPAATGGPPCGESFLSSSPWRFIFRSPKLHSANVCKKNYRPRPRTRRQRMSPSKFSICLIWVFVAACAHAQPATTYKQKLRSFHTPQEFQQITAGKVQIQRNVDPQRQIALRLQVMSWPTIDFTIIAVESPAVTWVGTSQGAIRLSGEKKTIEYFAGQRWLPDDRVTGIGFDDNSTWIETPKG